ncbi:catechol 2,3-dioxygenase-like lactoylglutathione lyase family enzyme [Devosia subaequoris]|uniref:Catechol 2,3-dioxygenase-like lactoylglutathione lyase family enzyme n=1 Tax=Devosia subaequoris TaxID=395930 RepID=A0A7W6IJJ3_9HYPH|nr:VOC family protein [Devosia subaequoris]MBB4050805.1 catechol 2,3-dioxygenase-like lactoylglutathione lyase family enzyme [Devosia subaequoris]MCP1208517.1 VOC family protein [Devosia subaequoris]
MELGAFSVSLAVKDIAASRSFYEKLGFSAVMGEEAQNWLIMKNGDHVIGLFQGMFDKNILTFNPGWNADSEQLPDFIDIRKIQQSLKSDGIEVGTEIDPQSSGPANFSIIDPDGNVILFDQHV